jgi:hypothetical protein
MNWSKIEDTALGKKAWSILDDSNCAYHNGWHVMDMYDYLHATNEPYDEVLDWAVLFHDIVYDNKPEKEFRSAKLFLKMVGEYSGCQLDTLENARVYDLIMHTSDHVVRPSVLGSSAIIRSDIHALKDPVKVFYNYMSILDESIYLYNIDENTFAENNISFMGGLKARVEKNIELDTVHAKFYEGVSRGIESTINLSRILRGDL